MKTEKTEQFLKEVEYKGEKFKIGIIPFGLRTLVLTVNGQRTQWGISNQEQTIHKFKEQVKKSIQEYIDLREAKKALKEWDGKLED